jgi:hypothetical protein
MMSEAIQARNKVIENIQLLNDGKVGGRVNSV